MKNTFSILILATTLLLSITGCVKKDFDAPPYGGDLDPELPVNTSIWQLKQLYINNNYKTMEIDKDYIIYGVVTANDKSGNYYKSMIIQDSSSAIQVNINKNSLYTDYPIGRKVYIKCNGLALGDYGGFIQLGYDIVDGDVTSIPTTFIEEHVVKASYPVQVDPLDVTIGQINTVVNNDKMIGMLVRMKDAEFIGNSIDTFYAGTPDQGSGTDLTIQDCIGDKIIVRTSNYSNFRAERTPTGNGTVTGIYSRYNTTAQILLRDTEDIKMENARCGSNNTLISVDSLKSMYTGSATTIPTGVKIKVYVNSDVNQGNTTDRNITVQDASGGIMLRLAFGGTNTSFLMGDELEVNISGQELSEYNGVLQVNNIDKGRLSEISSTNTLTPILLTVADINANHNLYESRLVQVQNATISGGTGVYRVSASPYILSVADGTGTTGMYTASTASFANDTYPTGAVNIKAVVSEYTTGSTPNIQLLMRRKSDVN